MFGFHLRRPASYELPPVPPPVAGPDHRFTVSRDAAGRWHLAGAVPPGPGSFPDLSAALDYARRTIDDAPATIELRVDGLYICVQQEQGWPQRICAPRHTR